MEQATRDKSTPGALSSVFALVLRRSKASCESNVSVDIDDLLIHNELFFCFITICY